MIPGPALARLALVVLVTVALAACSSGRTGLSPGLSARMDVAGAELNRAEALGIVNNYRATQGLPALIQDPSLDAAAQSAVASYARTGRQTPKPEGTIEIRYSAGGATFAETFSGWRGSPEKSAALTDARAVRAGLAVIYDENTPYGIYWAMIVG